MKNFKICRIPIWVILTRGEDYKVNLWAIGRPNPTAVSSYFGLYSFLSSITIDDILLLRISNKTLISSISLVVHFLFLMWSSQKTVPNANM